MSNFFKTHGDFRTETVHWRWTLQLMDKVDLEANKKKGGKNLEHPMLRGRKKN